ncbi:hypothetical protein J2X59_003138 [Flavobacterium sp. 260]|nr:hypothetical protein [Curtobacterium sp. 260]
MMFAWVGLMLVWALVLPMGGALAEANTLDAVFRLALGGGWPTDGQHHALSATRWILSEGYATPASTHSSVAELLRAHPGQAPDVVTASQNPAAGYWVNALALRVSGWASLRWDEAVLLLRIINVVLLAPLPALVFATARRFSLSPLTAAIAPVLLFAVPQLAQTGGTANMLALPTLLSAVAVWLGVRMWTGDRSWWTSAGLAVVAALAAVVSTSGLLVPVFALLCVGIAAGRDARRRALDAGLVLVFGGVAVVSALQQYLGTVHRVVAGTADVSTALPLEYTFGNVIDAQWGGLSSLFWGGFGRNAAALTPPLIAFLTVGSLAIICWALLRRERALTRAWPLLLWAALVIGAALLTGVVAARSAHSVLAGDGRQVNLAVTALVIVVVLAARAITTTAERRQRVAVVALVGAPLIAAYGLSVAYQSAYEASHFAVSKAGLATLSAVTPLGYAGIAAAVLLWGTATVIGVALGVRATRHRFDQQS